MKKEIFAIRDSKAEAFHTPFYQQTVGQAIRTVSDYVNNEQSDLSRHPEDYMLFHVGTWWEGSGIIQPLEQPEPVITLLELQENVPITTEHANNVQSVRNTHTQAVNGLAPTKQATLNEAVANLPRR